MNTMQPAIQTSRLTKAYGRGKPPALSQLDLTVNRGEIFGYLGPNGAGKTTTIRMMLDLIRPDSGSVQILGMDAQRDSLTIRRRVGFLPGELNLWAGLTGRQVITFMGNLRGGANWEYVNELAERLLFDMSKTVRSYSSGNRRKLGLILALMHKPELLILDEPTNGLDPLMQQTFEELAREAQAEGRTVFLSSHILSEVQSLCDRVAILREGHLQAVERVSDLMRVNFHWVTFRLRVPADPARVTGIPGVDEVSADGNDLRLRLSGEIDPVLRALSDLYIVDIRTQEPTLEEVFRTFYGNGGNGAYKHIPDRQAHEEVVR